MNVSLRFVSLSVLLATAACSGGGNNNDDAGADAAKESGTVKDSGNKQDTGTPPDDGGTTPTGPEIDPACTVPATPPSAGSCMADAGLPCNPVTNEGCDTDAGEACDFNQNTGFGCYPPPPPNTQALCASCDDQNTACIPGATCLPLVDAGGASACAKFCCDDSDCTPGHCDKATYQTDPLGVCVK